MFFDVIVKPQTWRNVGYLLLSFPLGIFYFVFLVTGLALGFGLSITLLGIPLLIGVLAAAYGLGEFERTTTNLLLDQATPPSRRLDVAGGLWPKVKSAGWELGDVEAGRLSDDEVRFRHRFARPGHGHRFDVWSHRLTAAV